jgi:hypothetical protein
MNDLQSFSAEAAQTFSDLAAQKREKELVKKANSLIAKINGKYEKAIKKELSRKPTSKGVKIGLGYFGIPNKHDFYDINKRIRNHYEALGFSVSLERSNESCGCIFDFICNHNQLYVHMSW